MISNSQSNLHLQLKSYKSDIITWCKNLEANFYLKCNIFLKEISNVITSKKKERKNKPCKISIKLVLFKTFRLNKFIPKKKLIVQKTSRKKDLKDLIDCYNLTYFISKKQLGDVMSINDIQNNTFEYFWQIIPLFKICP